MRGVWVVCVGLLVSYVGGGRVKAVRFMVRYCLLLVLLFLLCSMRVSLYWSGRDMGITFLLGAGLIEWDC